MLKVPGTVIVTGTPGAGKSTLLSSIADDKNFTLVSVGTLMLEFASKDKFAAGRDDLRHKSNADEYSELRNKAFVKIAAMKGNVVVDTHGSIEAEGTGRYVPGLPMESLQLIKNLKGFIYVDAHTDRILERRRTDATRKRNEEDPVYIDTQRLVNIAALSYYSSCLNIPLYVIFNRQNVLEESKERMKACLKEIFGEQ
jgi:adenylate kinase